MKKNLAKVIALGLVIGGVGFAGEASAYSVVEDVKNNGGALPVHTDIGSNFLEGGKDHPQFGDDTVYLATTDYVNDKITGISTDITNIQEKLCDSSLTNVEYSATSGEMTFTVKDHLGKDTDKVITVDGIASKGILENEITNRIAADAELQGDINANAADIAKEVKDREAADAALREDIGKATEKGQGNYISVEESLSKNVGELDAALKKEETERVSKDEEHDNEIAENEKAIAEEAARAQAAEQRIEKKFDGEVSRLDSRIDDVDQKVDKVGAMAAAMASLHTMGYDPAAPTEIAVGVGQYRDKTGLAIGAFHYPNRDFMLNFSISASDEEYMGGIGATWKIGRKSPEQLLKAEKEKEARVKLAKANAEAAAAERARVEAQQTKHAKMLAAK